MTSGTIIRMLPLHVANQIAAGEVVERPASVVKELMENSLDAGARRIEVTVVAGGRRRITVSDDGCGMVRDDAIMAIERQATSKLRTAEDLEHIATMGFRGEALASIAAVSRFTLKTRHESSDEGTEVIVTGGTFVDVRSCGGPVGTTIDVSDIFFNLPARRKFLRTFQTEQAQIKAGFCIQALAHPEVAMKLTCDGGTAYTLPACETLPDRLRDIYGNEALAKLRPVDATTNGIRVWGFAGIPSTGTLERTEQIFLVNRRAAVAPILYHALKEVYSTGTAEGRKPTLYLFIDLPADHVDVNVHPTKREVRFRNPNDIRAAVMLALQATPTSGVQEFRSSGVQNGEKNDRHCEVFRSNPAHESIAEGIHKSKILSSSPFTLLRDGLTPYMPKPQELPIMETPAEGGSLWKWFRIIGRLGETYLLLETDDGLVTLDPAAAHTRILFERLLVKETHEKMPSQRLLIPQAVTLRAVEAGRLRQHLTLFEDMGFDIEALDADSFMINALPAVIGDIDCQGLLTEMLASLDEGGRERGKLRWREEALARTAATSAVRRSQALTPDAMRQLVHDLAACQMPYICPRGKPTMILTSYTELARRFGHPT